MMNTDIKSKMKSVEMNQNENKKVWIAPEVEVLDGRKTLGGIDPQPGEDEFYQGYES